MCWRRREEIRGAAGAGHRPVGRERREREELGYGVNSACHAAMSVDRYMAVQYGTWSPGERVAAVYGSFFA